MYEEKTMSRQKVYEGGIINVEQLSVLLPNGKIAKRDLVLHPGASVVVPISNNNEIYMVRQFRKPIEKTTLELPAGKLDPGEDPQVCAERELKEETGLIAGKLVYLLNVHTTPGFCNEVLYFYLATDLKQDKTCTDQDEFIQTEKVKIEKLVEMVLNGEITDAKTIIGILLVDRIIKGEFSF